MGMRVNSYIITLNIIRIFAPAKGIRMFFRSVRSNRESGANPEQCSLL